MQLKKVVSVFNFTTPLQVVTQDGSEIYKGTFGEFGSYASFKECHVKDIKLIDPSNYSENKASDVGGNAYLQIKIKVE